MFNIKSNNDSLTSLGHCNSFRIVSRFSLNIAQGRSKLDAHQSDIIIGLLDSHIFQVTARTHTHWEITYFQIRQPLGPRKLDATGQVVLGAQWLPNRESCNFSMGMGSCFHPMTHGNEGHCMLGNHLHPMPFFSTGFGTGHGIMIIYLYLWVCDGIRKFSWRSH